MICKGPAYRGPHRTSARTVQERFRAPPALGIIPVNAFRSPGRWPPAEGRAAILDMEQSVRRGEREETGTGRSERSTEARTRPSRFSLPAGPTQRRRGDREGERRGDREREGERRFGGDREGERRRFGEPEALRLRLLSSRLLFNCLCILRHPSMPEVLAASTSLRYRSLCARARIGTKCKKRARTGAYLYTHSWAMLASIHEWE